MLQIDSVQPPLKFVPPIFNPIVFPVLKILGPLWMKRNASVDGVTIDNPEPLVDLFRSFYAKKSRFILAFRHPSTDDPPSIEHMMLSVLPRLGKQMGKPIPGEGHAHYLYERGILMWGGAGARWLFPRMGSVPIKRGTVDRTALKMTRELLVNGPFPLAMAPEGTVNGYSEIINPLEPGVAQMGFWCVDDLQKAGRDEEVFIVPIGLRYTFNQTPWRKIHQLLCELEADCGLDSAQSLPSLEGKPMGLWFRDRLVKLGDYLLPQVEQFYIKFYSQDLSQEGDLQERLQALLSASLSVPERAFNMRPKGELIERRHKIEQAAWNRIFREDIEDIEQLSMVEKALADRVAKESNELLWHMRIVENFVALRQDYVADNPTPERVAETSIILWDLVARLQNKPVGSKPKLGQRTARFTISEPISVTSYRESYKADRRGAVASVTSDLQAALENMLP